MTYSVVVDFASRIEGRLLEWKLWDLLDQKVTGWPFTKSSTDFLVWQAHSKLNILFSEQVQSLVESLCLRSPWLQYADHSRVNVG